jgi:hypothetical protein
VAGLASAITFDFTSVSNIVPGDKIEIRLLSFKFPRAVADTVAVAPGSIFDEVQIVRESATSVMVVLRAVRSAAGMSNQSVTIPSSAGDLQPSTTDL